jgi:transposase
LAAADGKGYRTIAQGHRLSRNTVRKWCRRYAGHGLAGLVDLARPGQPRRITAEERCLVIATACQEPSEHSLAGHSNWSGSLLAQALTASGRVISISARSVQRILKAAAIRPHRCAYWKQPIDPDFAAKMRPIIDLYLHPPSEVRSSVPTRTPASRLSNVAFRIASPIASPAPPQTAGLTRSVLAGFG